MRKPKLLFYDPFSLVVGGHGFRLCRAIELFKDKCDITLVLSKKPDWDYINKCFKSNIKSNEIKFIPSKRPSVLKYLMRLCVPMYKSFDRIVEKESAKNDLCVSFRDFGFFGVPGIHFITDVDVFRPFGIKKPKYIYWARPMFRSAGAILYGTLRLIFHTTVNFVDFLSSLLGVKKLFTHKVIIERDRLISNSNWIAGFFDEKGVPVDVVYPPVMSEFHYVPFPKRQFDFVFVGRIAAIKKIEYMIDILKAVRDNAKLPISFHIVGPLKDDDEYCKHVMEIANSYEWIKLEGEMIGKDKEEYVVKCKYAIHACEIEAFGISVVEYLKAGCIPFVPLKGAASEIVDNKQLCYDNFNDAVDKITRVLAMSEEEKMLLQSALIKRGQMFNVDSFDKQLKNIISEELTKRGVLFQA